MRYAYVVLVLLFVLGCSALSQPIMGTWEIGAGFESAVPMGDFSNAAEVGLGGIGRFTYLVDPNFALTGQAGYLHFSYKNSTPSTSASANIVPILVGGKYFLSPREVAGRIYLGAELGLYLISTSVTVNNVSGSSSTSKFGIAPVGGVEFPIADNANIDAHVNYTTVMTDGSSTNWVGVGIGVNFVMP